MPNAKFTTTELFVHADEGMRVILIPSALNVRLQVECDLLLYCCTLPPFQLVARVTMNVLMTKHALAASAKTHASLRSVESMQFVCQRTTVPTATVLKTTRVTHMFVVSPTSVLWMMIVLTTWLAVKKNAETPVTVHSMQIAQLATIGDTAHAALVTLAIHMALHAPQVRTWNVSLE